MVSLEEHEHEDVAGADLSEVEFAEDEETELPVRRVSVGSSSMGGVGESRLSLPRQQARAALGVLLQVHHEAGGRLLQHLSLVETVVHDRLRRQRAESSATLNSTGSPRLGRSPTFGSSRYITLLRECCDEDPAASPTNSIQRLESSFADEPCDPVHTTLPVMLPVSVRSGHRARHRSSVEFVDMPDVPRQRSTVTAHRASALDTLADATRPGVKVSALRIVIQALSWTLSQRNIGSPAPLAAVRTGLAVLLAHGVQRGCLHGLELVLHALEALPGDGATGHAAGAAQAPACEDAQPRKPESPGHDVEKHTLPAHDPEHASGLLAHVQSWRPRMPEKRDIPPKLREPPGNETAVQALIRHSPQRMRLHSLGRVAEAQSSGRSPNAPVAVTETAVETLIRHSPQRVRLYSLGRIAEAQSRDVSPDPRKRQACGTAMETLIRHSPQRARLRSLGRVAEAQSRDASPNPPEAPMWDETAVETLIRHSPQRVRLYGLGRIAEAQSRDVSPDPYARRESSLGFVAEAQSREVSPNTRERSIGSETAVEILIRQSPQRLHSLGYVAEAQSCDVSPLGRRESGVEVLIRHSPQRARLRSLNCVAEALSPSPSRGRNESAVETLIRHSPQRVRLHSLACVLDARDAAVEQAEVEAPQCEREVVPDVHVADWGAVLASCAVAAANAALLRNAAMHSHAARWIQVAWRACAWRRRRRRQLAAKAVLVNVLPIVAACVAAFARRRRRAVRRCGRRGAVAAGLAALLLSGKFERWHLAFKAGHVSVISKIKKDRAPPSPQRIFDPVASPQLKKWGKPALDTGLKRRHAPRPSTAPSSRPPLPRYDEFALRVQHVVADDRFATRRSFLPFDVNNILCPVDLPPAATPSQARKTAHRSRSRPRGGAKQKARSYE